MKILNGEIVKKESDIFYLGMWKDDTWHVSGIIYHTPEEVESNLSLFYPKEIMAIKVNL